MARKSTSGSASITTAKPKSIFLKPVTVDYKELFKIVAKGVGHTVAHKWDDLAADAITALTALGIATEPEEIAYELIQRALVTSIFDLLADSSSLLIPDPGQNEDDIVNSIESQLVDEPIVLDRKFLDRPLGISLVSKTQSILEAWLGARKSIGKTAKIIAQRFPTYFVYALNNEWRKNEKRYSPLKTALDTPFTNASDRETQWRT